MWIPIDEPLDYRGPDGIFAVCVVRGVASGLRVQVSLDKKVDCRSSLRVSEHRHGKACAHVEFGGNNLREVSRILTGDLLSTCHLDQRQKQRDRDDN